MFWCYDLNFYGVEENRIDQLCALGFGKYQRCGTAASFPVRSQPSGSSWVITTVMSYLQGQCKKSWFHAENSACVSGPAVSSKESSELWSELEKPQFGDWLSMLSHWSLLSSTTSIFIILFPSPVLPCPQLCWWVPPSSSYGRGLVPPQFLDVLYVCGTLKLEEVLRKRKRRKIPAPAPSQPVSCAPLPAVSLRKTMKFRFMER